jgi:SAM-dependent methyltransferase
MTKETGSREKRFAFGNNWKSFHDVLSESRIRNARDSLCGFLDKTDLQDTSFLDIGSGSGIFSLAARQSGATVRSFDYDPLSVDCTQSLKERFFPADDRWTVEEGSALDRAYLKSLGQFDVCYSWGVLHHTGALYNGLYNANLTVKPGGLLYIAIYNDQGFISALWKVIKKIYCSGAIGRCCMTAIFFPLFFLSGLLVDLVTFTSPFRRYREHGPNYRGMSLIHDWRDWLGGYPYEPASIAAITAFYENLGFTLLKTKKPRYGFGNNEFLFRKES